MLETSDPVDFLLACHARIRGCTALARQIAEAKGEPNADLIDSVRQLHWFFGKALPLHAEDEDRSVAPRLLATPLTRETRAAISAQAAQHPLIDGLSLELAEILRAVIEAPTRLDEVREAVSSVATELALIWDVHLIEEEDKIFPVVRKLPAKQKREMLEEFLDRDAKSGWAVRKEAQVSI